MTCVLCKLEYDLPCSNITPKHFYLMDEDRKKKWNCQECRSRQPKSDNTNTPVRATNRPIASDSDHSLDVDSNVTHRLKKQRSKSDDYQTYVTKDNLRIIIKQEITETIKQLVSEQLTNIAQQISDFHESLSLVLFFFLLT